MKTLLIANRGEIARRIIRTARAMGIRTVALYSDADRDLPHPSEADLAVHLPGTSPAQTYLRTDLILDAARRTGADAVHPGYGFLSENADFAQACLDAGLTFVGPSPDAIERMGSKIASKELMRHAGVPVLPSYEVTGLETDSALTEAATGVGFPVLVKASAGGGGRGMRIVREPAQLADAVAGARREAESAFGDGTVFLERYVESSRHVEVQVLGDTHGGVVGLFERECSIQRRHQKIIEEAPSPAVDADLRKRMIDAAVAAAEAISYVGAGTVEFLLEETGGSSGGGAPRGEFFFLEMNTRLQVEHPVTEMVTGLDLVRAQLSVATGTPLSAAVRDAGITGHAVEARVYAEDPAAGWLPSTGTLTRFEFPAIDGVRVDAGYRSGSVVSPHYDPMLAKVIAYGQDRAEATRLLVAALRGARLHGLTTNRDLLVAILTHPEFESGATDTGFLERHEPAGLEQGSRHPDLVAVHACAAALALLAEQRVAAPVARHASLGWSNAPLPPFRQTFTVGGEPVTVSLRFARTGVEVTVADAAGETALDGLTVLNGGPGLVDLEISGLRHLIAVDLRGGRVDTDSALGSLTLVEQPRLPEPGAQVAVGSLVAPMPGSVVRVQVSLGDTVTAGQVLVVLEAMKMEHSITAPADGVVAELSAAEGTQVDTGTVLAVVTDQDGTEGTPQGG
ncbi:MAG TPA: biotin carboxylase N-terminal domain-containing protein [Pseudonocardia sp.]|nr:biotin carboxylase N-terminal domain-containing protein [Pseudonocardia sp.]